MKRARWVLALMAMVLGAWLLTRARRPGAHPTSHEHSEARTTQPRMLERVAYPPMMPTFQPSPQPSPRSSQPTAEERAAEWGKKARDRHDLFLNMKPERVAEIEAVAPRLNLTPEVVQTLSRWSDTVGDLIAVAYAGVTNEAEFNAAERQSLAISKAYHKAEIRLLGDLANWNRYNVLKGYSMTGLLHTVDNDGNPLKWGPYSHESIIRGGDRFTAAAEKIDTAAFDRYFQ